MGVRSFSRGDFLEIDELQEYHMKGINFVFYDIVRIVLIDVTGSVQEVFMW